MNYPEPLSSRRLQSGIQRPSDYPPRIPKMEARQKLICQAVTLSSRVTLGSLNVQILSIYTAHLPKLFRLSKFHKGSVIVTHSHSHLPLSPTTFLFFITKCSVLNHLCGFTLHPTSLMSKASPLTLTRFCLAFILYVLYFSIQHCDFVLIAVLH